MEQNIRKYAWRNPREKANIFSIATFFYNYQILKKGKKSDFEEKDLYKVLPDFSAQKLGNKLESQWNKDTHGKLWKSLIKCFGLTYLLYTVVQLLFGTGMIIYQPKVFSKFVAYFQPNQTEISTGDAYLYAALIIGLNLLNILYTHNFVQLVTEYSLKVRTAVCSLIFRKALRISSVAFSEITIGKTVTLISKDVFAIDAALSFIKDMAIGFLQLMVVTYILYQRVGISAFPPVAVIVMIIPIQIFAGRNTTKIRLETANRTDQRFGLIQETLSAIKIIKMYTWQTYFEKIISQARLKELQKLRIVYYLKALIGWLGAFTINIAFYVLLISYIAQGHTVQAETVYFIQQCLFALRSAIMVSIPMGICSSADLNAAFSRIQTFLDAKEVTPQLTTKSTTATPKIYLNGVQVLIGTKCILKSVSLTHDSGLLLITGNIGSGKSILLKTILGEFPTFHGRMDVRGSISYAPEEPWLFPSTIRQNILFGQPYEEKRYQEILNACALTYDINQFDKSDLTIVGDKGVNLSKGQQARITLARAIYRDSDIYLLDDCLSSLDNNVSNHIFNNCIKGFLKDKLTIFVSQNISILKQVNNTDMLFLENGITLTLEQQTNSLDKRITYYMDEESEAQLKTDREALINYINDNDDTSVFSEDDVLLGSKYDNTTQTNLYHEEKKDGGVHWSNYVTYYRYMGGFFVLLYLVIAFAAAQGALSYSEKLISLWVNMEPKITSYIAKNQENTTDYQELIDKRDQHLNLYTVFIIASMVVSIIRSYSTFYVCINAAQTLHDTMVKAMLHACMYFYDKHYIGNIINRLSKDLYVTDEYMPFLVFDILRLIFSLIGIVVLVGSVNALFFIPAVILLIKLYIIQRLYIPTGRSLRRLEAATRSPIIGYLNSTLEGLSIARASQQENKLKSEFDRHQDLYTSAYYTNQTTIRFFAFLLDIIGVSFVTSILFKFLVFSEGVQPGDVGLAISQAMMLSGILQYATKQVAELETVMTSVERIEEYTAATPEKKIGKVLSDWLDKGHIKFSIVSLTYKTDERKVLKELSFEVGGGSKIGIVGRTGAGKTSIISALFRLYDFDGRITIDNEDITGLSLDFLRANISIIPQDPVLFSGTIRSNIDPYERFLDEDIWKTLEKVHLKHAILDLDQPIDNYSRLTFSSGQKQLLCLARALIQKTKIIVLDEATANLDAETDLQLQKTIQRSFKKCTVIIIAHKLHSVMWCDKVMVLDDGRVVEFDEPNVLLKNKGGMFYRMIGEENFEAFVRLTHI